jgi:membrane protein
VTTPGQQQDRSPLETEASVGEAEQAARGQTHRVRRRTDAARQAYAGSSAEHLWQRLDAMDFINRGMLFAAILLLCMLPFFIVVNALAGRSAVASLTRRLGLNREAAADVGHLFTSASATSNAVTGTAWVFFVLSGIAVAAAIQELYERAFGLERRGLADSHRRIGWLAVMVGVCALAGWVGPPLRRDAGPVTLAVVLLATLVSFWWFTMWFLLGGRVSWRALLPSAVATALCWFGMEVVFSIIFSGMVISNEQKYGPIGVVFSLMSWLIAIGVVIILGAIIGVVWRERGLSFAAAFRRLSRRHGRGTAEPGPTPPDSVPL